MLDAVQAEYVDYGSDTQYKTQHIYNFTASAYGTSTLNSVNPTVTINGQTFSHSGTLTAGQRGTGVAYNGYLSGVVEVEGGSFGGSREVNVEIAGTRVFAVTNGFVEGMSGGAYYGRYIGTLTIVTITVLR